MSVADASARGLKEGDRVRIFNDRGETFMTVHLDNTVQDGLIISDDGPWMRDTGGSSFQTLANDKFNDRAASLMYGANIAMYDTLTQVEKA